jgi:hypothetical protein
VGGGFVAVVDFCQDNAILGMISKFGAADVGNSTTIYQESS